MYSQQRERAKKVSGSKRAIHLEVDDDSSQDEKRVTPSATPRLSAICAAYESLLEKKENIQAELMSSQNRTCELEFVNDRLKRDQGDIMGEMETFKKKMVLTDMNLATATDLYTILKNKLEEATNQVAIGQDEITQKHLKIEELQLRLEVSKKEASKKDTLFDKLGEERKVLEKELKKYVNELEKKQDEFSEIQRQNVRLRGSETTLHETKMENDRICRDVVTLEHTLKELRDVAQQLQRDKDNTERELHVLQKRCESALNQNEKLSTSNEELERELEITKQRYFQYDNKIKELKLRETQLKSQLEDAAKTAEELNRLRVVIANMQKRVDIAFTDLECKDQCIQQIRNEKDNFRKDCDSYSRQIDTYKASLEAIVREKECLSNALKTSTRRIDDFEISIKKLQDENTQYKEDVNAYEARVPILKQSLQKHQAHETIVKHELTVAKSTMNRFEKEIDILKEENASLIRNIENYDNKNENLAKELADSCTKIFELRASNQLMQRENEELKRDTKVIKDLEDQLSSSQRVINDLKVQCNDTRIHCKKNLDDYNELKAEFDHLQERCEDLEEDGAGKNRVIENLRVELSQVSKEALEAEMELSTTKTIVQRDKEETTELMKDMNNLKQRNYDLDSHLKTSRGDKDKLQKLVTTMRTQATDVESEIEKIQRKFEAESRSNKSKVTNLESAVDMSYQARDLVVGHLETEKCLAQKYKEEFERIQREYLEHQKTSEKYNVQILERDRIIKELNKQIYVSQTEIDALKKQTRKHSTTYCTYNCTKQTLTDTASTEKINDLERKNDSSRKRINELEYEINTLDMQLVCADKENRNLKQKINDFVLVFVDPSAKDNKSNLDKYTK